MLASLLKDIGKFKNWILPNYCFYVVRKAYYVIICKNILDEILRRKFLNFQILPKPLILAVVCKSLQTLQTNLNVTLILVIDR